MARKQMITREIKTIIYTVKAVTKDDEITTEKFELQASLDTKKVRPALEKACELLDLDMVKIISSTESVHLYGMEIPEFMRYAVELDPITRAPLKND